MLLFPQLVLDQNLFHQSFDSSLYPLIHPSSAILLQSSCQSTHSLLTLFRARKQAERAARGKQSTRRANYFDSMVVDYLAKELEKESESSSSPTTGSEVNLDSRMAHSYPWDDTPPPDQETASSSASPHTQAPMPLPTRSIPIPAARPPALSVPVATSLTHSCVAVTANVPRPASVPASVLVTAITHTGPLAASSSALGREEAKNPDSSVSLPSSNTNERPSSLDLPLRSLHHPPVPPAHVISHAIHSRNFFSLFWLKRSSLPCVRTDWTDENVRVTAILIFTFFTFVIKISS